MSNSQSFNKTQKPTPGITELWDAIDKERASSSTPGFERKNNPDHPAITIPIAKIFWLFRNFSLCELVMLEVLFSSTSLILLIFSIGNEFSLSLSLALLFSFATWIAVLAPIYATKIKLQ